MFERLRRLLPTREALASNRWLRWMAPALSHPRLWHMSRRGIAMGCAIGVFFGLLVPIAQIPFATGAAVLMRANVPAAVASTLVTNPVTFGPVYYAAWRLGSALLGEPQAAAPPAIVQAPAAPASAARAMGWIEHTLHRLGRVGKPLLLGLALFAVGFGLAVYALVHAIWRLQVAIKRRQRRRSRGR